MAEVGSIDLVALVRRIAGEARTEATLQSEIHTLLLVADLNLEVDDVVNATLEAQTGPRRRIDIEIGHACIEVKKRLSSRRALDQSIVQLGVYVRERTESLGQRYVGILTDGSVWNLYHQIQSTMMLVSSLTVDPASPDVSALIEWLGAVLATQESVAPTPQAIRRRLGTESAGFQLDLTELDALYTANKDTPEIAIKRELWAKLLTTALGTQFRADDYELFVNHTLLVAMSEVIAHAVLGFDIADIDPATLIGGELFSRRALISGVVEHDFFDWPLACGEQGSRWVKALARRLSQFDWAATEHDAMKTIYESVISPETRKSLGEYYTPDFLAEHMVEVSMPNPLAVRVLDPACGSGTFLFHAVRRYLDAADESGLRIDEALNGVTNHVAGIDLHPVAVTLARVTYLLAIGAKRLRSTDRPPIRVPVYIGDSIEWGQRQDLFSSETLNVETDDGLQMFADQLRFPQSLLNDADRFDQLIGEMSDRSANRSKGSSRPSFATIARKHGIVSEELEILTTTFDTMCRLHDEGRDHIWGYFVRNLARPAWFARPENRVDVLVGNPPWLSYRFMTTQMQARYKEFSTQRGLWAGRSVATQQDLSDVFVVRTIERYLKPGGTFTFVMPAAVLSRGQFSGFRSGNWSTSTDDTVVSFDVSWDLSKVTPYFFPRTSAVIFGTKCVDSSKPRSLNEEVVSWSGFIPNVRDSWARVRDHLRQKEARVEAWDEGQISSPYGDRFTNGATIFPRVLTTVVEKADSPLGVGAGRRAVHSDRGTYEKKPWKNLPTLEGVIEDQFLYPLLLGECVLPFRQVDGPFAVLPVNSAGNIVEPSDFTGLSDWWSQAEAIWGQHRSSKMDLVENLDYRHKLTNQFPLSPHRVVVAHSAMHVACCRVRSANAVIEHQLDWTVVRSKEEGLYLCAVLNSPALTALATPFMTSGKGGGRHIGKSLWRVPIPQFDAGDSLHTQLVTAGAAAEVLIEKIELPRKDHGTLRRIIRNELAMDGIDKRLNELVAALLSVPSS